MVVSVSIEAGQFDWDSIPLVTKLSADPAAGAQIANLVVPAGKRWLWYGGRFALVTDGTVINRTAQWYCQPDGTTTLMYVPHSTQAATSTHTYGFTPNRSTTEYLIGTEHYLGWGYGAPAVDLSAGAIILVSVGSLQGGDNLSAMTYYIKEAPE